MFSWVHNCAREYAKHNDRAYELLKTPSYLGMASSCSTSYSSVVRVFSLAEIIALHFQAGACNESLSPMWIRRGRLNTVVLTAKHVKQWFRFHVSFKAVFWQEAFCPLFENECFQTFVQSGFALGGAEQIQPKSMRVRSRDANTAADACGDQTSAHVSESVHSCKWCHRSPRVEGVDVWAEEVQYPWGINLSHRTKKNHMDEKSPTSHRKQEIPFRKRQCFDTRLRSKKQCLEQPSSLHTRTTKETASLIEQDSSPLLVSNWPQRVRRVIADPRTGCKSESTRQTSDKDVRADDANYLQANTVTIFPSPLMQVQSIWFGVSLLGKRNTDSSDFRRILAHRPPRASTFEFLQILRILNCT